MKNKITSVFLGISFLLSLSSPVLVFAQAAATEQPTPTNSGGAVLSGGFNVSEYLVADNQKNTVKNNVNIGGFIIRVINFLALMIGSFAFLAIVVGGFFMITATGNQNRVEKGKNIVQMAVFGLVIAMSAYFVTAFFQSIFYQYGQ